MAEIVATNIIASQPPKHLLTTMPLVRANIVMIIQNKRNMKIRYETTISVQFILQGC